jgi:hypothetical protein
MWTSYSAWLLLGLGCALSFAAGGRRVARHAGRVVTWSDVRRMPGFRENWPDALTDIVVILMICSGASTLNHHGLSAWWVGPIAVCGLALLPAVPALIHNAQFTGRLSLVLRRTAPAPASSRTGQ